jgi:phage FluMu protein Com
MPTSPCTTCGAMLKHDQGVAVYRCPRCKTVTHVVGAEAEAGARTRPEEPLRPTAWRVPFNDGWAGTSVFTSVTLVVSAVIYQFKSGQTYQPAFLALALATVPAAVIIVGWRIRRIRSTFDDGIVLQAVVRRHERTEMHVGKVHTLSSLMYDYEFEGTHYESGLPYATGASGSRKVGRKLRANRPDVSTWLLGLDEGDSIDILISRDSPQTSYIVRLFTGMRV